MLARPGADSVSVAWSEVAACAAEVVLVAPCGYHLDERGRLGGGGRHRGLLPPGAEVWALDADAIIVRPGPRLVEGSPRSPPSCTPNVPARRPLAPPVASPDLRAGGSHVAQTAVNPARGGAPQRGSARAAWSRSSPLALARRQSVTARNVDVRTPCSSSARSPTTAPGPTSATTLPSTSAAMMPSSSRYRSVPGSPARPATRRQRTRPAPDAFPGA